VAVDVPPSVKGDLAAALSSFRDRVPGARWTREDQWHVTLKFLGATWPRLLDDVREAVRSVALASMVFGTSLTAFGIFPTPSRARVMWAGLSDADGRFRQMVGLLDGALRAHFEPEKRPFTPHLTVARLNPPRDLREAAGFFGTPIPSEPWAVTELVLYRSHLSPKGATYEAVNRFPIGA
jgi:2'-5' RNA ligase